MPEGSGMGVGEGGVEVGIVQTGGKARQLMDHCLPRRVSILTCMQSGRLYYVILHRVSILTCMQSGRLYYVILQRHAYLPVRQAKMRRHVIIFVTERVQTEFFIYVLYV